MQTVSEYLIQRLADLGINEVFGVPGDYNFNLIEAVERNPKIGWIGCANELNSAYAADGYARLNSMGAVITTYGVGELSAINGIAGSYAESLPIIKIGGIAKSDWIKNKRIFHHCLNGSYEVFKEIYSKVTCYSVILDDNNAQEAIETALSMAYNYKKPVYIGVYDDLAIHPIKITREKFVPIKSDGKTLNDAVFEIMSLIQNSKNPLVISEYLILRNNLQEKMKEFLKKSNFKYTTMAMGKGSVDEQTPNFIGTFTGHVSDDKTLEAFNKSDLILGFGVLETDFNTGGYSVELKNFNFIDIGQNFVKINGKKFENILMKDVLDKLIENVKTIESDGFVSDFGYKTENIVEGDLTQDFIYAFLQDFLEENDVFVAETGLCAFGSLKIRLPKNVSIFFQSLWGSIGWATPATLGLSLANKSKKVVLLTGEGSHQMTAQEIATMERYNVKPIVIVVNNDGYTIERYLTKDPMDELNNIANWDYSLMARAFSKNVKIAAVKSKKEFVEALTNARKSGDFTYIEAFVDTMDAPKFAKRITQNLIPTHE